MYRLAIVLCCLLVTSCARVYIPNVVNTPLMEHQGDADLGFYMGTAGFEGQAAYALGNHLGVMGNACISDRWLEPSNSHKHWFTEVGAGYFTDIPAFGVFEIYAGAGLGEGSEVLWGSRQTVAKGAYQRFFLCPTIASKNSIVDLGLSTRICYSHYTRFRVRELAITSEDPNLSGILFEPVLTASLNQEYYVFRMQSGLSITQNLRGHTYYAPVMLHVGFSIHIGSLLRDKPWVASP